MEGRFLDLVLRELLGEQPAELLQGISISPQCAMAPSGQGGWSTSRPRRSISLSIQIAI